MSDDSDAGPRHKRKRKPRRLEESSSSVSSGEEDGPVAVRPRSAMRTRGNPIRDSSSSDSSRASSVVVARRKRNKVARVSTDSDSDSTASSGSSIVRRRTHRRGGHISSPSGSSSQWETDDEAQNPNVRNAAAASAAIDSDSSDGQADKCPICLAVFRTQEVGTPAVCDHKFCLECIQEWSKNMNTCPVDRQEYTEITVKKSVDGKVVRRVKVEKPQAQNDVVIVEDPTFCEICGTSEFEDRMLLCDGCDLGFHLFCLTPPLEEVPVDEWYCNDCSPDDGGDREITLFEIELLFNDQDNMERPVGRRRLRQQQQQQQQQQHQHHPSTRLIPRTRQSERVQRQIQTNRTQRQLDGEMPGTSSRTVSSTTGAQRPSRPCRKKSRKKRRTRIVYKIDEATGETVAVTRKRKSRRKKKKKRATAVGRPKTAKKRLAAQLGICAPRSVPQILPDMRSQPVATPPISAMRYHAGIQSLDIYGHRDQLDYFSDGEDEFEDGGGGGGGGVLMSRRRAPNHSDVLAFRRAARRKAVCFANGGVSSTTCDLLGTIMDAQERLHSRKSVLSVDKDGKLRIDGNRNVVDVNERRGDDGTRQAPASYTNNPGGGGYRGGPDNGGGDFRSGSSSAFQRQQQHHSFPSSTVESRGRSGQDQEEDFTQDIVLSSPPQNRRRERKNSDNSESDVDVYSDIEKVSTSKTEGTSSYKPSPPPQAADRSRDDSEDNDSDDADMVIDTEKEPEKPDEEEDEEEDNTKEVTSTVDSDAKPQHSGTYSQSEIQSEAVQSSNQVDDSKSGKDDEDDEEDEEEDSEDGCPNFSIYSKESISLAKDTDVGLSQDNIVSSSPNNETEQTAARNRSTESFTDESMELPRQPSVPSRVSLKRTISGGGGGGGGLYSDSEDESMVRKEDVQSGAAFEINDIRDMTEDISEEERSYTPCLDEKNLTKEEGIEGLDTEMISDEERNDFDESHERKTVSDGGDALEINAKESELDFTRPEDFEEGEIPDKNKKAAAAKLKLEEEAKRKEAEEASRKSNKAAAEPEGNKENEKTSSTTTKESTSSSSSFKRLSKNTKERNYRDKDRSKSREKKTSDKSDKSDKRKKERRREIERYNVRALMADKPRRDEFGRDVRQMSSRSRTRSRSSTISPPPGMKLPPARSRDKHRSKSPRRRGSKEHRKRKRSTSRHRRRSRKSLDKAKSKRKARSTSKRRSRSTSARRKRNRRRSVEWTPSFSRSPSPGVGQGESPSWTPPRPLENLPTQHHSLKVILPNDGGKKKKKDKKGERRKESQKKRTRYERTPPPSKEVFASGENILVSVSFNKENESRDVLKATREKRRKPDEEKSKKKKKVAKPKTKKIDVSGVKPVAYIDLDRSPFREIESSPKEVIVVSDSDNAEDSVQKSVCDSSQQDASPVGTFSMGPKTPPEPQVKFALNAKPATVRPITNPLHDDEPDEDDMDVETDEPPEENGGSTAGGGGAGGAAASGVGPKGPNTPPEPPNSSPGSPEVYDPFEPTKSRSASPETVQDTSVDAVVIDDTEKEEDDEAYDLMATPPDALKSMTPPVADVQPADSQSGLHSTPDMLKSPVVQAGLKSSLQIAPFSTAATSSLLSSVSTANMAPPRINILNSTIVQSSSSSTSTSTSSSSLLRLPLPCLSKPSPVKISPPKPGKSSGGGGARPKQRQNGGSTGPDESSMIDFDSPYSPGSSDYEDLFEPPPESAAKPPKPQKAAPAPPANKVKNTFDTLFGSPTYTGNKAAAMKRDRIYKVQVSPTKPTKQAGMLLDEDNLKILDELPNSAVEMQVKDKFLKKLNRQERVVEEVKLVLKPHYNKKRINKEEYKDILRRAVPKICHNKSGEINPTKIKALVEAYVKKFRHSKKVTSSSSSLVPQKV